MDIKEIALKLLAKEFPGMRQENQTFMVEFAEALISAYKGELLKESGEPVAYFSDEFFSINTKQNATFNAPLYTSDQLTAAILKATKPLEEEIERLRADNIAFARNLKGKSATTGATYEHICAQLTAAQEEIKRLDREVRDRGASLMALAAIREITLTQKESLDATVATVSTMRGQLAKAEQRVAEAIHDMTDEVCAPLQEDDKSVDYWHGVGAAAVAIEKAIVSDEWRKFVKEV